MDNSEASTVDDRDTISEEERNLRNFITQMVKSRIFCGQFQERRYVEPIKGYRDVIVIHNHEVDLINDIDIVRTRLRQFFGYDYWIGLTDPNIIGAPKGYCIWIESETNLLGSYWFKIKGVKFRPNEIIFKVKILRSMTNSDENMTPNEDSINLQYVESISQLLQNFSWENTLLNVKKHLREYLIWFFTVVLTVHNIKEALTFLLVLFATIGAFSIKGIVFLMEFSLKFMRETSYFIQSATPVTISVVNMIGKIFGGFYLLILTMWRDNNTGLITRTNYPALREPPRHRNRSSVIIKEIE